MARPLRFLHSSFDNALTIRIISYPAMEQLPVLRSPVPYGNHNLVATMSEAQKRMQCRKLEER